MTTIKPSAINATIAELLGWRWQTCGIRGSRLHWHEPALGAVLCHDPDTDKEDFFLHDARGTVMLLEKMAADANGNYDVAFDRIGRMLYRFEVAVGESRISKAVAHAFLRANGIEVSE